MPSHLNNGAQFFGGFLVSVALAYWLSRRTEDRGQIESEIYGSIGTAWAVRRVQTGRTSGQ